MRDLTTGELRTINFLLGDISDLTPNQKIDVINWYRGGENSEMTYRLKEKILKVLEREGKSTVAVIRNRTRNKYSEKQVVDAFESLVADEELVKFISSNGVDSWKLK